MSAPARLLQHAKALIRSGRFTDAVTCGRIMLLAQPDRRDAAAVLVQALIGAGRTAEADAVLEAALERHPAAPELIGLRADVLAGWGDRNGAIAAAEKAAELSRRVPADLVRLATLRAEGGEEAAARALLAEATAGRAEPGALTALARMQRLAGQPDAALDTLGRATHPLTPESKTERALCLLATGRIAEGFRAYDARWKTGLLAHLDPGLPPWRGDPLAGRVLLVRAEQGFSECLQFFRLAGLIEGGRVVVEAPPALVPILRASHRVADVIAQGDPLPQADCWAPMLSLPRLLRIDGETIPDEVPYLRPDPSRFADWRDRLGPGPKIGIAWHGGQPLFGDPDRAIPLAEFAPLATIPGIRLISLQKGEGRGQIDTVPFPVYDPTDEMDEGTGAFLDTAVVMQQCALIVTAGTAIAHLAGALARPCWAVLPDGGDWRFGWHPSDSPWYPTLECLRRPPGGSWRDVFDHIARRLTALRQGQTEDDADPDGPKDSPRADPEPDDESDRAFNKV